MLCRLTVAAALLCAVYQSASGQMPPDTETEDAEPKLCSVDPRGRPDQELVKVDNARYYVWHEGDLWHLRTAAKGLTSFSGSIKLTSGSLGRLRPIGLEKKARNPDKWTVNAERTEIRFEIHTVGKFDGFDFDVRDGVEGRIEYDLKIGKESRNMPRRIYIGPDAGHPEHSRFALPITPTAPPAKSS